MCDKAAGTLRLSVRYSVVVVPFLRIALMLFGPMRYSVKPLGGFVPHRAECFERGT